VLWGSAKQRRLKGACSHLVSPAEILSKLLGYRTAVVAADCGWHLTAISITKLYTDFT
jgi:hypothetical protein